ncbi:MAG: hypothetical protein C0485_03645 [Pirellula sp.]|nr:hypothetical protein [Pirellula sp.]
MLHWQRPYRGRNFWNDEFGLPLFKLLHSESAFISNRQGLVDYDLVSSYLWVYVVAAVVLSTIIAQVVVNWRKVERSRSTLRDV